MSNTNALGEAEQAKRNSTIAHGRFCKAFRRMKSALLVTCVTLTIMIASTQRSNAAYYDNYYSLYQYYLGLYYSTWFPQYYYDAIAYYFYYLAGFDGDYFGYYYDGIYKS